MYDRPFKAGQKLRVDPPLRGGRDGFVVPLSWVRVVHDDGRKIVINSAVRDVELLEIAFIEPGAEKLSITPVSGSGWEDGSSVCGSFTR